MSAEKLRDAITKEMLHYSHSKLQTFHAPYVLHPVSCSSESSASAEESRVKFQPSTTSAASNTFSQSESSATTGTEDTINDVCLADVRVQPAMPGISTAKDKVYGNSIDMPSASACQQSESDDVTMLSARSITDDDVKLLKDEICQQETHDKSSNWTDTSAVTDNCTDTAAAADGTQSDSNLLVVNTNPSLADDAKARIKAALLNSGRQRQRLGEYYACNSLLF